MTSGFPAGDGGPRGLVLIRHGQTPCTVEGRFCGGHDSDLTDVGARMAGYCARHPALDAVEAVVCSPSRRAVRTAEAVASVRGLPVVTDERLRELSFGEWENRLPAELRDAPEYHRWVADPALFAPPGGESGLQVLARTVAALRDALLAAPRVAVVSHKSPIRLALAFFLGVQPSRYRDIAGIGVGTVSHLHFTGRTALRSLGDVSHLPEPWRQSPDRAGTTGPAPVSVHHAGHGTPDNRRQS